MSFCHVLTYVVIDVKLSSMSCVIVTGPRSITAPVPREAGPVPCIPTWQRLVATYSKRLLHASQMHQRRRISFLGNRIMSRVDVDSLTFLDTEVTHVRFLLRFAIEHHRKFDVRPLLSTVR